MLVMLQIFSWDVKTPGYNVLLASLQPSNMLAMSAANAFFQAYIPGSQRTVPHTANGLAYPWSGAGQPGYVLKDPCLPLRR